jgi:apolipoprotein N-acyltransferase
MRPSDHQTAPLDEPASVIVPPAAPARHPLLRRRALLLAAASGVLQVVIFPALGWSFLCWIAIAPLLVALSRGRDVGGVPRAAGPGQGFLLGYVAGLIWSAGSCYWIFHVMNIYGGLSAPVSLGILVLFTLAMAVSFGVFGLIMALLAGSRRLGAKAVFFAPIVWVATEWLRGFPFDFRWDPLGTVLVNNIPVSRLATVTGVYGLSFEIVLVNTAFAAAFLVERRRRRLVLVAAIVVAALLQAGNLVQPPALPANGTARLVQADIPILNSDQWTPQYFQQTLADLTRLSIPQPGETDPNEPLVDLIVWPETPAPFFTSDPTFRNAVSNVARQAHAAVVAGALGVPQNANNDQLYNSAALVAPDGVWMGRYDKIHLVPFGEYVPFASLLRFAGKLTREVGDFIPGTSRQPLRAGDYRLGTFICYESIFPDEIRQFAKNGATVFVNISNDGWFGHTAAPLQHLEQARMRAIENRRWLLRDTNTGITASIDPYGRVVAQAQRDVRTWYDVPYSVVTGTTFYTRHGDWFLWTCAIITILAMGAAVVARRTA